MGWDGISGRNINRVNTGGAFSLNGTRPDWLSGREAELQNWYPPGQPDGPRRSVLNWGKYNNFEVLCLA